LLSIAICENNTGTRWYLHRKGGVACSSAFPRIRGGTPRDLPSSSASGSAKHEGVVGIPRRVFQRLLDQAPTPERCLEAYHLQRTRLELIAEKKVRRRQLTDDGNIEITGPDLRERDYRRSAELQSAPADESAATGRARR
jgi:hypothetical protein